MEDTAMGNMACLCRLTLWIESIKTVLEDSKGSINYYILCVNNGLILVLLVNSIVQFLNSTINISPTRWKLTTINRKSYWDVLCLHLHDTFGRCEVITFHSAILISIQLVLGDVISSHSILNIQTIIVYWQRGWVHLTEERSNDIESAVTIGHSPVHIARKGTPPCSVEYSWFVRDQLIDHAVILFRLGSQWDNNVT